MRIPRVEEDMAYEARASISSEEELCFQAQELLYAYAKYDRSMMTLEETPDAFKIVPFRDDDDEYYDDDDYDRIENIVDHFKTNWFELDDFTRGIVDNIPFIEGANSKLRQLILPGFVAIKAFANENYDALFNELTTEDLDEESTTQLIFRLPFHTEGAAIFQGFCVDDGNRLVICEETVEEVGNLLVDIGDILRYDLIKAGKISLDEYLVQSVPVEDMGIVADRFLKANSNS